jgi:hypothetical protein
MIGLASELIADLQEAMICAGGDFEVIINSNEKIIAVYADIPKGLDVRNPVNNNPKQTWTKFIAIDTEKMKPEEKEKFIVRDI